MKEEEMKIVANYMFQVFKIIKDFEYSEDKEIRNNILKEFREFIKNNTKLKEIKNEVKKLCKKFPVYK
jgi:glycine/serine hydroxymethyltransferase